MLNSKDETVHTNHHRSGTVTSCECLVSLWLYYLAQYYVCWTVFFWQKLSRMGNCHLPNYPRGWGPKEWQAPSKDERVLPCCFIVKCRVKLLSKPNVYVHLHQSRTLSKLSVYRSDRDRAVERFNLSLIIHNIRFIMELLDQFDLLKVWGEFERLYIYKKICKLDSYDYIIPNILFCLLLQVSIDIDRWILQG